MVAFMWVALVVTAPDTMPAPEHGLHFATPVTTWDEALPLGNGVLGALVWGDGNPVRISLDRTDLWDLRPVEEFHTQDYTYATMQQWEKEGRYDELVKLYEAPYNRPAPTKIPAGRIELTFDAGAPVFASSDLDLATATASISFGSGATRVWVHATEPVGFISIDGMGAVSPHLVAPAFGGKEATTSEPSIVAGELANLGYPPPRESHGGTWQAYEQEGWDGFRFAVYLAWRAEGTSWLGAWSVATSSEGGDPLTVARTRTDAALTDAATSLRASHEAWWANYWTRSSIDVPNPAIERQWYLDTYKFGAASRAGHSPITLQGPWTADDGKLPPWKGDYHHDLNTELSYWPCYSGNRLEEGENYVAWLWDTRENCRDWTKRFFGVPGINVPMTGDLNNSQIGGWRQYTHSATTGAWLAHHFYLHWKYSGDDRFLRDRAYPYLRDCAVFLEAITAQKDADGLRTLPLSSSPEINDNKPNAWFPTITNYDLALIRWLFTATAEMADLLEKPDDATHWRSVLAEMPSFSKADDGRLLVAKDYPLEASHRHFSHLMAIHPLGLIDASQGDETQRTIAACLAELDRLGTDYWCGYSFAWLANLAARAHDGAKAANALDIFAKAFVLRNSFHCNGDQSGKGYSKFDYRPFTLEGNFAAAAGLQEMLLQSHTGVIEIFPAIPAEWRDVSFHQLRAQGAYLVSAEFKDGQVVSAEIHSERGGTCRVKSPADGTILTLDFEPGQTRQLVRTHWS